MPISSSLFVFSILEVENNMLTIFTSLFTPSWQPVRENSILFIQLS
jgi:hypothetical protein